VNGHAVGAGFALALACDMRIASTEARFFANFVRIGVHPGMGTSYLLPRTVGTAKAFEILLAAEPISAQEALSLCLVNRVVAPGDLMGLAMSLARKISSMPQLPVRFIKRSVHMGMAADLGDMLEYESFAQALCAETEDMKRAVAAFHQKRGNPVG
jgi:enoyl-CoA hydratase/carnithine racemase